MTMLPEFIVKFNKTTNAWEVYSSVQTNFGKRHAENYVAGFCSRKEAYAFKQGITVGMSMQKGTNH